MKAIRYLVFVLVGLIVLLLAAAAFVAATFDAERVKSELVQVVKDKKDRTLKIEGDLGLSFFPSIGVKLGKASLSEHGSDKEFAALDSARVSVQVIPLLSKRVVVDTVDLAGVKATLVRHKDGSTNIDDLLSKEPEQKEAVRFNITGVKIAHSQLAYRDELGGRSIALADLNLDTGRVANAAEGKLTLSTRVSIDQPKSAADVKLSAQYRYDLDKKSFGVAKLEGKIVGELAGIQGLDLALAAGGVQVQPATGEIALDDVSLAARGKEGADSFDVKLSAPRLAVAADKASGAAISIDANLAGARRTVVAKLNLSGVEGSARALKIARLALDLDAKLGDTAIKGGLSSAVAANLDARTVDLPRYGGEFSVAHPQMPMKSVKLPLSGGVRADLARQSVAGDASTQFDESRIQAKFNVARFNPLAFGFDLDIDRLNVDRYFPPKTAAAAAPSAGAGGGAKQAEQPFDFSALKGLDAHGTVRIGALQVSNVKASNVRLELKAANGRLDVAPHSASLYNGSLSGALSLNASNNSLALRQNLSNVSINPLMKDAINKDLLEGRGNVAVDVTTAGTTMTAMKKALAGSASVSLRDGAIKGINLAQSFRNAKAALSMKQDAEQKANKADKTDFSEFSASVRIARGIARNDDLSVKSPFLRIGGAGDINIGEGSMNYVAKASVVNTSGGQGGRDLEHLKGLTVPVRVTGPFDNLSYRLEFASLVGEAAKAKVEEKKEELKQKAQEKLREGLKGLLKR